MINNAYEHVVLQFRFCSSIAALRVLHSLVPTPEVRGSNLQIKLLAHSVCTAVHVLIIPLKAEKLSQLKVVQMALFTNIQI